MLRQIGALIFLFMSSVMPVLAATTPETYTNENFLLSQHEMPVSFSGDSIHGFYGTTVSGRLFSQTPIVNNYNIALHRFSIDEAYFYISDHGIIYAKTDLAALSIYFSRTA